MWEINDAASAGVSKFRPVLPVGLSRVERVEPVDRDRIEQSVSLESLEMLSEGGSACEDAAEMQVSD